MKRSSRPPAEPEIEFLGREVSCGVFAAMLRSADEHDVDVDWLVDGTGYSATHFRDPTQRVSWSALQTLTDRLGEIWDDDQLRAVGAQSVLAEHFDTHVLLARLFLRPPEAYAFVIRGDERGDFACLVAETVVDGLHVSIDVTIAEGYGHSPAFFTVLAGAAEGLPTMFGLPSATVTMTLTDRGANYSIEVPRGGWRRPWLRVLRRMSWGAGRTDQVAERLARRTESIEASVAKRLAAEAGLTSVLRQHERRLASLNDAVVELGPDGRVNFVSPNLETVLRMAEADFVTDPLAHLQPVDEDFAAAWITRIAATNRWVEVNPSRYADDDGAALLLVIRDVTERVQLSTELATSRRLESLGVMATGVAHDFNNLLVPIVANIHSILDELPSDSPLQERVRAVETAARLSAQLVDQILATTGRSVVVDDHCDVAVVVSSMAPLLAQMVDPEIELRVRTPGHAPAAIGRDPLGQLLTNLTLNASEAITGRGTVSVTVEQPDPDHVVLCVTDDGAGMTGDQAERMTEPFFTTRPSGRGLGLAALAGLLHSETATLSVITEPGRGTEIRVSFASAPDAIDLDVDRPSVADGFRDARLLLVDDDDLVRGTLERTLSEVFDSVTSVGSAAEALDMAVEPWAFDCLVTDLTMPTMRGPDLIVELRRTRPELPCLLLTGAGINAARTEVAERGLSDVAILAKPFTPFELVDAVRVQLAQTVRPGG